MAHAFIILTLIREGVTNMFSPVSIGTLYASSTPESGMDWALVKMNLVSMADVIRISKPQGKEKEEMRLTSKHVSLSQQ